MNNYNNDDDVVPMTVPTEGPFIVMLLQDQPKPRNKAIFNIIASDLSSECKAKVRLWYLRASRWCSNTTTPIAETGLDPDFGSDNSSRHPNIPSEHYRRTRQEFLCFVCCFGGVAIVFFFMFYHFIFLEAITDYGWDRSERDRYRYNHDKIPENMKDDDYSAYKGENFREKIKYFLYGDDGFA